MLYNCFSWNLIFTKIFTKIGYINIIQLSVTLQSVAQGRTASFALHVVFSLLNSMYVPYAAVYYVDRVHLMCSINAACHYLSMSDYLTTEILLLAVGVVLQCPIWFFVLLLLDNSKSGGNVGDFFKRYFLVSANLTLKLNIFTANHKPVFHWYTNLYFKVTYSSISSYSLHSALQFKSFNCVL